MDTTRRKTVTQKQRKPLSERVKWKPDGECTYLQQGLVKIEIVHQEYGDFVGCVYIGDTLITDFCKNTLNSAKAEALRIVQTAFRKAAEAWRD